MRGRLAAWAAAAAVLALALVHPTYAVPCGAIMVGIMAGSWRAHLAVARSAVVAVAVSILASSAVAVWIWWVAIRGGERRVIVSHSDEFLHHGASAYLMYPWAPVFGRGYVLVAIVGLSCWCASAARCRWRGRCWACWRCCWCPASTPA